MPLEPHVIDNKALFPGHQRVLEVPRLEKWKAESEKASKHKLTACVGIGGWMIVSDPSNSMI